MQRGSFWLDAFGLIGVVLGSTVFMALFVAFMIVLKVPGAVAILGRFRRRRARQLSPAKS